MAEINHAICEFDRKQGESVNVEMMVRERGGDRAVAG
jgi:hypothetical protein